MELFPWVAFILALVSLPMVHIAKYIKKDRKQTMVWMWIGVVSTIAFMIWAWFYSGWD